MISPISPDNEGLQTIEFPTGLEVPINTAPQLCPIHTPLCTVDVEREEQLYSERRENSPNPDDDHESQSASKPPKRFGNHNLYRAGVAVLFLIVAGAALVWGVGGARIQECSIEHTRSRTLSPNHISTSPLAQVTSVTSIYTSEFARPTSTLGPFLNITQPARVVIREAPAVSTSRRPPLTAYNPTPTSYSKSTQTKGMLATRESQQYDQ